MSPQGPHFNPHSTAKTNDKSTNLRKNMASIYISDSVTASVYSEKTRMKKLVMMMKMIIISIVNKSQETNCFSRAPEIDFRYETKATKVLVDFKFDALYR